VPGLTAVTVAVVTFWTVVVTVFDWAVYVAPVPSPYEAVAAFEMTVPAGVAPKAVVVKDPASKPVSANAPSSRRVI
jgi:hypothetical protein